MKLVECIPRLQQHYWSCLDRDQRLKTSTDVMKKIFDIHYYYPFTAVEELVLFGQMTFPGTTDIRLNDTYLPDIVFEFSNVHNTLNVNIDAIYLLLGFNKNIFKQIKTRDLKIVQDLQVALKLHIPNYNEVYLLAPYLQQNYDNKASLFARQSSIVVKSVVEWAHHLFDDVKHLSRRDQPHHLHGNLAQAIILVCKKQKLSFTEFTTQVNIELTPRPPLIYHLGRIFHLNGNEDDLKRQLVQIIYQYKHPGNLELQLTQMSPFHRTTIPESRKIFQLLENVYLTEKKYFILIYILPNIDISRIVDFLAKLDVTGWSQLSDKLAKTSADKALKLVTEHLTLTKYSPIQNTDLKTFLENLHAMEPYIPLGSPLVSDYRLNHLDLYHITKSKLLFSS